MGVVLILLHVLNGMGVDCVVDLASLGHNVGTVETEGISEQVWGMAEHAVVIVVSQAWPLGETEWRTVMVGGTVVLAHHVVIVVLIRQVKCRSHWDISAVVTILKTMGAVRLHCCSSKVGQQRRHQSCFSCYNNTNSLCMLYFCLVIVLR